MGALALTVVADQQACATDATEEHRAQADTEGDGHAPPTVPSRQSPTAPALPEAWSVGDRFRDCPECPELVVVPAGSFAMGTERWSAHGYDDEGPIHKVTFGSPFAVGVHEVTVAEFGRFVAETDHSTGHLCWVRDGGERELKTGRGWRNPGFQQTGSHPVVCVNWNDAQRYVAWLSDVTRERYRLPSESEWEYAARAGSGTRSKRNQCAYANGADWSATSQFPHWEVIPCDDGHVYTAPVGSYRANAWGLHDTLGNAAEWTQDCWHERYDGAPTNGAAWESGECARRVLRGGTFSQKWSALRTTYRDVTNSGNRIDTYGFRVVRSLER